MNDRPIDLTTVSDQHAVVHVTRDDGSVDVHVERGLTPDAEFTIDIGDGGTVEGRTLPRLPGELLAVVATVNDVHFGEVEAGRIDDLTDGPIRRSATGEAPYPVTMNTAAAAEMAAAEPAAVIVKGDISNNGHDEEWEEFDTCYGATFGEKLHVVRGNHDAYRGQNRFAGHQRVDVDGLTIALLDTVIPGRTTGRFSDDDADWLTTVAADADRPVLVMGHHQQWIAGGESDHRPNDYFGIHPDDSDRLDRVAARHSSIIGYTAGHTHRHRRRTMIKSEIPSIEVGCTKDFPGTWAEHRVFESGVMHLIHRIGGDAALRWSESCRGLYADFGIDYSSRALGELADRCFVIPFCR